jgi:UDP-N-acetyl-D-glucosamine dehydrogenase
MRDHHFDMESTPITADSIASMDLVLLATNHSSFDYPFIQKHAKVIVDTRGVYQNNYPNVVKS